MIKPLKFFCQCTWLLTLLCASCFYDVEEEVYGDQCSNLPATYSGAIISLLQTNCLQCHSNASREGNISLEGYNEVLPYITDGSLLGSIEQASGYSPMPQNRTKLLDCDIEKFREWINGGAEEN